MSSRWGRLLLIALMVTSQAGREAWADDVVPAPVPASDTPQQIIVLLTGRVITGDVVERPGGYLVNNEIGQVVIPFTQVRLTAADLPDAYRKLKAGITSPTATAHVTLGEWCFTNRLYDSAREQAKAALLLEPQRTDARTLLKQVEQVALGGASWEIAEPVVAKSRDGFVKEEVRSLDGLSPSVTKDFVRRVQPLVLNKCGNAACHGSPGPSDFRLTPVRLGMSGFRGLTDRNLSALLKLIDVQQPEASPLLVVPSGVHGGNGSIWTGPRADDQLAELRDWVRRAAFDQSQHVAVDGADVRQAGGKLPAGKSLPAGSARRDPFLREILDEERPDPFDPAIFNRRMHGRE